MNRGVLVLLAAVLVVSVPTGSLSATTAARDVSGRIAPDTTAYVGVEMHVDVPAAPVNPNGRANATRATSNATQPNSDERNGASAPNRSFGRENGSASVPTEPSTRTLLVTVQNRVPHLDSFDAVVSAEPASGNGDPVTDRIVVDDEATAVLPSVSCGDTVRIEVRSPDVRMELTRRVPCESRR